VLLLIIDIAQADLRHAGRAAGQERHPPGAMPEARAGVEAAL